MQIVFSEPRGPVHLERRRPKRESDQFLVLGQHARELIQAPTQRAHRWEAGA